MLAFSHTGMNLVYEAKQRECENKQLEMLLPALNTDPKLACLLILRSDQPQTSWQLWKTLRDKLGETPHLPKINSLEVACRDCFTQAGIVKKTESEQAYALTETGERYAQPLAAYFTDYLFRIRESAYSLLGFSSSKGATQAPFTRFLLLEALAGHESATEKQLAQEMDIAPVTLLKNLKALALHSYLDFSSVGRNGERAYIYFHTASSAQLPKVKEVDDETVKDIYRILKQNGSSDKTRIAKRLKRKNARVGIVLKALREAGHAALSKDSWAARGCSSKIIPFEKTGQFVNEVAIPFRNALNDGYWLARMRKEYLVPLQDSNEFFREWVSSGLASYAQASGHKSKKKPEEALTVIRAHMGKQPQWTKGDVARALKMSESRTSALMQMLIAKGEITAGFNGDAQRVYAWKQV